MSQKEYSDQQAFKEQATISDYVIEESQEHEEISFDKLLDNIDNSKENSIATFQEPISTSQESKSIDLDIQETVIINGLTLRGANKVLTVKQAMSLYSFNGDRTLCLKSLY